MKAFAYSKSPRLNFKIDPADHEEDCRNDKQVSPALVVSEFVAKQVQQEWTKLLLLRHDSSKMALNCVPDRRHGRNKLYCGGLLPANVHKLTCSECRHHNEHYGRSGCRVLVVKECAPHESEVRSCKAKQQRGENER